MSILTSRQKDFLKLFTAEKDLKNLFYLSGGTALAEYHLQHRLSEDLDFFTNQPVDFQKVFAFINKAEKKLKAKKVEYNKLFDRRLFYLHFPSEILKTEFTEYPFKQLKKPIIKNGILVDSFFDIATNKLFVIQERFEPKDYVDLYFILAHKKYSLHALQKAVAKKFGLKIDNLNLGSRLSKGTKLPQLPKLLKSVKKTAIEKFFYDLSQTLKKDIFAY